MNCTLLALQSLLWRVMTMNKLNDSKEVFCSPCFLPRESSKNVRQHMGRFAQLVMGPAGAGKSTYCATMEKHFQNTKRTVHMVNLDPAAEVFNYEPSVGTSLAPGFCKKFSRYPGTHYC